MDKDFNDALAALNTEGKRLGFTPYSSMSYDIAEIRTMEGPNRTTLHFKHAIGLAWAHTVDVTLHVSVDANQQLECSAEISWSSTGRSVSMAVASVALYQRAIEFAALAECIMTGVIIPIQPKEK